MCKGGDEFYGVEGASKEQRDTLRHGLIVFNDSTIKLKKKRGGVINTERKMYRINIFGMKN